MNGADLAHPAEGTPIKATPPTEVERSIGEAAATAANGTAVALPIEAPTPTGIEQRIGTAMADAVIMIGAGVIDWENDGLRPSTRQLAGERFAKVCMLQLEHLGDDFGSVARREGRHELWRRNDAAFRAHYGASFNVAAIDRAFDELLDHVLSVTSKVCADERAHAH
jgi:hypothetical protein